MSNRSHHDHELFYVTLCILTVMSIAVEATFIRITSTDRPHMMAANKFQKQKTSGQVNKFVHVCEMLS